MKSLWRLVVIALTLGVFAAGGGSAQAYYSGPQIPGNPLSGRAWFIDEQWGVFTRQVREWWGVHHQDALILNQAAGEPMSKSFGGFVPNPVTGGLRAYLVRAAQQDPGALPFIASTRIEHNSCPYRPDSVKDSEKAIDHWYKLFSKAVGNHAVEVTVEADRLAVLGCLPHWARARRYREIGFLVHLLHRHNPNAIVYIDAGASDWQGTRTMASRLRKADIAEAQGFALGASHFDWTSNEVAYGMKISRALGGKHFVINTNMNGWGPKPRFHSPNYHGGCMPPGEGVGIRPTVATPDPQIDGFLWLGVPGFASGGCLGHPSWPYQFYPQVALNLVRNANPSF